MRRYLLLEWIPPQVGQIYVYIYFAIQPPELQEGDSHIRTP